MSFCSCDIDAWSDVWNEKRRKAKEEHICYECGEKIERKEEYIYVSSLYDGHWSNYHICEYCDHDWRVLEKMGYCKLVGGLQEAWEEAWEK